MKYLERAALALLLLTWCGCSTSKSSEQHLEAVTAIDSKTHTEEHKAASGEVKEGPWTETVYEFAPRIESGVRESNPSGRFGRPTPAPIGQPRPDNVPETGPLVKVTVRDYQGRDTTWQANSDGLAGAETHAEAKVDAEAHASKSTRWGPPWWVWLAAGGAIAGAGWLAWKFKPPALSFLWRLLP